MNILLGCEYSAVVRDAFIAAGHDAWSCDLLPTQGRQGNHLQGDVRWAIEGKLHKFKNAVDIRTGRQPTYRKWDMAIFFPDCTYLCNSGLHWNSRGRMVEGRPRAELTEEALAFVRYLLDCDIERVALENPTGCISTRIRKPDQIIQPYHFGEDASKATCLWLKNLPKLQNGKYVEPRLVCDDCKCVFAYGAHYCPQCFSECYKPRWANQTDSGQNRLGPSDTRGLDRAKTYPGVARAMVKHWGRA